MSIDWSAPVSTPAAIAAFATVAVIILMLVFIVGALRYGWRGGMQGVGFVGIGIGIVVALFFVLWGIIAFWMWVLP